MSSAEKYREDIRIELGYYTGTPDDADTATDHLVGILERALAEQREGIARAIESRRMPSVERTQDAEIARRYGQEQS